MSMLHADAPTVEANQKEFESNVLPILRKHCFECHSHDSGESSGGLMLDSLSAMSVGGSRGPSLVAGVPERSLILEAVRYTNAELQMPPDGKLPDHVADVIRGWIAGGAHVPKAYNGGDGSAQKEDAASESAFHPTATHWAYLPPKAWNSSGSVNELAATKLDEILLARLHRQQLDFSPRADRRTLIRRLSYDLTGLPPALTDIKHFLADDRPDRVAVEQLVEFYLSSPHFGERFARYWMDVARYADNKGYVFQEDREYPEAYKYRDWLIRAFNADLPYDRFVSEQLAADLLATADEQSNLPALGFITLGRRFINNKLDIIDDRLDVVSRGLMGMTLACARCHDHKYDPITQEDYYSLAGVFLNSEEPGPNTENPGDGAWPHRLRDAETMREAHVLLRGSPANVGPKVDRKFVSFLSRGQPPFDQARSGRAELAEHIVSASNPLTARVIANRVWLRLTGSSLVETPSDFGMRCPAPIQLELLDQLAIFLVRHDWSIKALVREIVLSECYAQASLDRPEASAVDPDNALYWRMNRRRLDFEALRDTLLTCTDNLENRVFGKSEKIHAFPYTHRRTLYAYIDRQNLPSVFRTFDMASPDTHNAKRAETSVPQQGLYLLNSDFVAQSSAELAKRIEALGAAQDQSAAINSLFELVLRRPPASEEIELLLAYIEQAAREYTPPPDERWICGFGAFDPKQERLAYFTRLPVLRRGSWQGGEKLPDEKLGWSKLTRAGGHPGNDLNHAVARRWIAPRNGQLRISGLLQHDAPDGTDEFDGVRGSVLLGGNCLGRWLIQAGETRTNLPELQVLAGQTIDFVTDCVLTPNHDSFNWRVKLQYMDGESEQFDSLEGFPGERVEPLSPWGQVVQILLATNELAFVD